MQLIQKMADHLGIDSLQDFAHVLKRERNQLLGFLSSDPMCTSNGSVSNGPLYAVYYKYNEGK